MAEINLAVVLKRIFGFIRARFIRLGYYNVQPDIILSIKVKVS